MCDSELAMYESEVQGLVERLEGYEDENSKLNQVLKTHPQALQEAEEKNKILSENIRKLDARIQNCKSELAEIHAEQKAEKEKMMFLLDFDHDQLR